MMVRMLSILIVIAFELSSSAKIIHDWSKIRVPQEGTGNLPYGLNLVTTVDKATGAFTTVKKDQSVSAIVWALPDDLSNFVHPELREDLPVGRWLKSRKNLGISMSGGGMRAATCALGWLRALNTLGVLNKARYISCNSGGSWVNLPLSAKDILEKKEKGIDISFEEYLGKYVEPSEIELNPKELGKSGEILAEAGSKIDLKIIRAAIGVENTRFTQWVARIDRAFVQPYDISNLDDFYLGLGNAMLWNEVTPSNRLTDKRFPFTICAGTAYPLPIEGKDRKYVPFEFTPLYCGIPFNPKIYTDLYRTSFPVDGGFVQSLAFNSVVTNASTPRADVTDGSYIADLPLPPKVVKVAEISGISSAAPAFNKEAGPTGIISSILGRASEDLSESSQYDFWSPTSGGKSQKLGFIDGALYDNSGVIALLRRGCDTVICCVAVDSDINERDGVENNWYDFANLFGVAKQKNIADDVFKTYNRANKVFENSEKNQQWNKLITALKNKVG
jgi:hypothetical protein